MKEVTIYTDGACSGNPGPGGWGAVLLYNGKRKEIYGCEIVTTNNRMEILAAIRALEQLKEPCKVRLYTDSIYLKNGVTVWLEGWKAKNWKTAGKKSVKNLDLWQELDIIIVKHNIQWFWVKAHAGDEFNELADSLACKGRDEAKLRGESC